MTSLKRSFSTDAFTLKIVDALAEDLGFERTDPMVSQPVGYWRSFAENTCWPLEPYAFKKHMQLASVLKKYTFENDVYTPTQVHAMTIKKFLDNQKRLDNFEYHCDSSRLKMIMMAARGWCERTLGEFDNLEHLQSCYFASKASIGVPLARAILHERLRFPLSGTSEHIDWFHYSYLQWNSGLREQLRRDGLSWPEKPSSDHYRICDTYRVTLVPKSYKELRLIVPNTTIGGLYSNGLGSMIRKRLVARGYDISSLQTIHRTLARQGSLTYEGDPDSLDVSTVDQSLASDNITVELAGMILPKRWLRALLFGRTSHIELEGIRRETKTLGMMGVGYTFPLQTLLFLSLMHGLAHVVSENRRSYRINVISAYGDDLIYDSYLDKNTYCTMEELFASLGLLINREKSFLAGSFKESCGGDYYRGLDVRPAKIPEGGTLSARRYEAFLYKTYNVFKRRWDLEHELPRFRELILAELKTVTGNKAYCVPTFYSDQSGLHTETPRSISARVISRSIHGTYSFKFLDFIPDTRRLQYHGVYYSEWLRLFPGDSRRSVSFADRSVIGHSDRFTFPFVGISPFKEEVEVYTVYYRGKLYRRRKHHAAVVLHNGRYRESAGSTDRWS